MNKLFAIVLALMLITICAAAEGYTVLAGIMEGERSIDLNGDGREETVSVFHNEDGLCVSVTNVDGDSAYYQLDIYANEKAFLADFVKGDGMLEVLVSGNFVNYDFSTYCLRYDGSELNAIPFENDDEYSDSGRGEIEAVLDGALVLSRGWRNLLGARFFSTRYVLNEAQEVFILPPGGLREFEYDKDDLNDGTLVVYSILPVTLIIDGVEVSSSLMPGESLLPTMSDLKSIVYFELEDGRTGYFPITFDTDDDWECNIYGVNEGEWFEYIHYAG